jgi:hypothetical protein
MMSGETELEMVRRHVREGIEHVARQYTIINKLRAGNYPTELAEEVLLVLQSVQIQHEAHLDRILKSHRP